MCEGLMLILNVNVKVVCLFPTTAVYNSHLYEIGVLWTCTCDMFNKLLAIAKLPSILKRWVP